MVERYKKRLEAGDAHAMYSLGYYYREGEEGLPQDDAKALELWHRAAELGCAEAYNGIGSVYNYGRGVEIDIKKASHYWELAAIRGNVLARHNLGASEGQKGNMDRALKHYMIAVRDGFAPSLKNIKILYSKGVATKEEYTTALQLYQEYLSEIKSDQRDKAAAADEENRYY